MNIFYQDPRGDFTIFFWGGGGAVVLRLVRVCGHAQSNFQIRQM